MEKEKRGGLFQRLLAFWLKKEPQEEQRGIGFWTGVKGEKTIFSETVVETGNGKKESLSFWGEGIKEKERTKTEPAGFLKKGQEKYFFPQEERTTEKLREVQSAEKVAEQRQAVAEEKRRGVYWGMPAEIFREKAARDEQEGGLGKAFLWTVPEGEPEGRQKIPVAAQTEKKKETPAMREAELALQGKESSKWQDKQENLPDIDRLMGQITKRLWEEREGCGRRLNR